MPVRVAGGDRNENARAVAEAAARASYGRLVAYLAARTRDVAAAEDALADAFAAALEQWPRDGVPANPEAWLLSVARRRQIDAGRRRETALAAREHLMMIDEERSTSDEDGGIPDERLRLMFACAHPAIDPAIRAPLILQTVLGLDAGAIASAFLVPAATMGQRLVRAKVRIKQTGIPFTIPDRSHMPERLDAVLAAIYAAFSEGWADAGSGGSRRRTLALEGIWLGRLMAALMPEEGEALSLLALMLFAEARRQARRDAAGAYVPLADQETALWDGAMLGEAEELVRRAGILPGLGRYQLEAAVQAVHAARRFTGRTDWQAIARLYEAEMKLSGSPVVAINRAVALAETEGPSAALAALDAVVDAPGIADYQPYWAARAEFLGRAGDVPAARAAYDRAVGLETDAAVRNYLIRRKAILVS